MWNCIPRTINLSCPSPRRLRLPFHRNPAWSRRFSVPQRQKALQELAIGLTWRPSSLAKVGCIALTSRMHGTCLRVASGGHVSLINAKVTKTVTSLLRSLCPPWLGTFRREMTQVFASRTGYGRGISPLVF